jgi:hypothetical protein
MSGELTFRVAQVPPGALVAFALFPDEAFLPLFDPALLIVVVWIVCPPLPIHLPLQSTLLTGRRCQLLAEGQQSGLALAWHHRQGGGPNIEPDRVCAVVLMLLLDEGVSL